VSAEIPPKDSYDEFLQFSRITHENWLAPDRKNYMPLGVAKDQWVEPFLELRLETTVPRDVIQVFEVARGCMIYSWFFYPLATLAVKQCTRGAEFAARERCCILQQEAENFGENLRTLIAAGIISVADESRWQVMRELRNNRSHLKGFMLTDPGQALGVLRTTAELINALFSSPSK